VDSLTALEVPAPTLPGRRTSRDRYLASVRDRRTQQEIIFTSRERLRSFDLEQAPWRDREKHCDGLVVGSVDGESIVCFVELKGTHDERAMDQLAGTVDHFHPAGRQGAARAHGDEHHDRWSAGEDTWAHMPSADHRVVGVAIGFHRVPRAPPTFNTLGGKNVGVVAVQVARERNQAVVSLEQVLRNNGLL
jgi:hypothetical protein